MVNPEIFFYERTLQTMTNHSSEHRDSECWGEASITTQADAASGCSMEDLDTLEDLAKLRQSVSMGKKDSWDGRTKGVTLTQGSRQWGWRLELEALSNHNDLDEEPG